MCGRSAHCQPQQRHGRCLMSSSTRGRTCINYLFPRKPPRGRKAGAFFRAVCCFPFLFEILFFASLIEMPEPVVSAVPVLPLPWASLCWFLKGFCFVMERPEPVFTATPVALLPLAFTTTPPRFFTTLRERGFGFPPLLFFLSDWRPSPRLLVTWNMGLESIDFCRLA